MIMYLSRLQLNTHSRQMWRTVIDQPYRLHQMVMRGFPNGVTREKVNVLHRLEIEVDRAILLVQSDLEPDWGSLHPDILLPASPFDPIPNPAIRKMDGLQLTPGRILQFRLTANPTKRLSSGKGNKPGKRIAFYKEADQLDWLQERAAAHGFRLLDVQISHSQKQTSRLKGITLHIVQYNGRLQIIDVENFQTAMHTGIGPAKAFGCGLLSLAPVRG
jgi:CRISPR system Cascade subunit CasE